MQFIETRGNDGIKLSSVTFSEAILSPSASFGGLYIPEKLPLLEETFLKEDKTYKELALEILKKFNIDIEESVIKEALNRYDLFDDKNNPVPISKIEDDVFISELYHGPTRAFKDMALQPFGYILSHLAQTKKEKYLIMAATSGDTGPATLESFKNQEGVKVVCLYPEGGTSDVQRLQMVTEDASNLKVIGVKGNFDDTQNTLKTLLASDDFKEELNKKDIKLSAANSVNFGRIIFQIIYHIYSYLKLVQNRDISLNEKVYMVVPSGNFGNALGAYYAKKMGLPIDKILIASNSNNILTDWIKTGIYDLRDRELIKTISPAMDILKSSNVERILFDKFGANRTKELMDSLTNNHYFKLNSDELKEIQEDFDASFATDDECSKIIGEYAKKKYLMDTHTATAIKTLNELKKEKLKAIIYSTAEWTKFSPAVSKALGKEEKEDTEALKSISNSLKIPIPDMINSLFTKDIKHKIVVKKEEIKNEIIKFI